MRLMTGDTGQPSTGVGTGFPDLVRVSDLPLMTLQTNGICNISRRSQWMQDAVLIAPADCVGTSRAVTHFAGMVLDRGEVAESQQRGVARLSWSDRERMTQQASLGTQVLRGWPPFLPDLSKEGCRCRDAIRRRITDARGGEGDVRQSGTRQHHQQQESLRVSQSASTVAHSTQRTGSDEPLPVCVLQLSARVRSGADFHPARWEAFVDPPSLHQPTHDGDSAVRPAPRPAAQSPPPAGSPATPQRWG